MKIKSILFGLIFFTNAFFVFAQDNSGPVVTLKFAGASINASQQPKIQVSFSEPVLRFTADMVSIDGGNITSVRKLNQTSYLLFVRAASDATELDVQVQAGVVSDKSKNLNDEASNDLLISVNPPAVTAPAAQTSQVDTSLQISNLLQQVQNNAAANAAAQQAAQAQTTSYYYCAGVQIPSTQACNPQQYQQTVAPVTQPVTTYTYDVYGNIVPVQTTQAITPYYGTTPTYYSTTPYYAPASYSNYYGTTPYYGSSYGSTYYEDTIDNGSDSGFGISVKPTKNSPTFNLFGW